MAAWSCTGEAWDDFASACFIDAGDGIGLRRAEAHRKDEGDGGYRIAGGVEPAHLGDIAKVRARWLGGQMSAIGTKETIA